jgi:hypothetical protein
MQISLRGQFEFVVKSKLSIVKIIKSQPFSVKIVLLLIYVFIDSGHKYEITLAHCLY